MKKFISVVLAVFAVTFAAGVVQAQTAASKTTSPTTVRSAKTQTNVPNKKSKKTASRTGNTQVKTQKSQEATKNTPIPNNVLVPAPTPAKPQANEVNTPVARPVKTPQPAKSTARPATIKTSAVGTPKAGNNDDTAADTDAFAAFESTFVAPAPVAGISFANVQATRDVQEEAVLSPSAPRY